MILRHNHFLYVIYKPNRHLFPISTNPLIIISTRIFKFYLRFPNETRLEIISPSFFFLLILQ